MQGFQRLATAAGAARHGDTALGKQPNADVRRRTTLLPKEIVQPWIASRHSRPPPLRQPEERPSRALVLDSAAILKTLRRSTITLLIHRRARRPPGSNAKSRPARPVRATITRRAVHGTSALPTT